MFIIFCQKLQDIMHLFGVAFIVAGVLYAIFEEQSLILYFLLTVGLYIVIGAILPRAKNISNRKKIMVATWGQPQQGNIYVKVQVRAQKVLAAIEKYSHKQKLTITHFAIRACGDLMTEGSDMNGKLTLGKFVPFDTVDISCLVDIDGGKDLAMILIKDVANKSVVEIANFIKQKGSKIKSGKGDADHKKRTKVADYFPAFLVSALLTVVPFFSSKLGISVPALAIKKDQFGVGCVTSLGMLNFIDAIAPFTGFTKCVFLLAVNAVHQTPVVQDGKVEVGKVINCNFTVDHRYVDGGKAKTFISAFQKVFENPQKYIQSIAQTQSSGLKQE